MKKKLMMVAVLLGALSLGACVDDNESQSVTDLRGAKAEQLRALAAYQNAQAEAEALIAAAEAELKSAQAEWYAAQAAELNQQTQEAADRFAITVQELQAKLQVTLIDVQKQLADAERLLADAENQHLTSVFFNYKEAVTELNTLNSELTRAKASVAYKEAGVKYAEANAKVVIASYERSIASYQAQIEVLQDPAYTNVNDDELFAQYEAAQKKATLAWNTLYSTEGKALKEAGDAVKAAYDALDMDAIQEVNNFANQYGYYPVIDVTYGDYIQYATDIYGSTSGFSLPENFKVNETNTLYLERVLANAVTNASNALGTPQDAKDKDTAYGRLALANANLTAAQALKDDDPSKKGAIAAAEEEIAQRTDELNDTYLPNYNQAVENQDDYKTLIAAIDLTAYNNASAAILAADEKENAAQEAYDAARETPTQLDAEATALQNLYYNATNINDQIAQLESNIANAEKWIEYYKNDYVTESEVELEELNKEIEDLTEQIAIQQQIVDAAKAALDEALNATPDAGTDEPADEPAGEPSEEQPAA